MSPRRAIALALAALSLAGGAQAEETTVSHGISAFGELKYPADFPHFDYVNPQAPQGGTMSYYTTDRLSDKDMRDIIAYCGK